MNVTRLILPVVLATLHAVTAGAQSASDLADISLDDLTKIEVTSVSQKEQELFSTPSAIFVLTNDDIRRSGASTVAEALRLVPGVHVARLAGDRWEVAARGFNWLYGDKLVVLLDGLNVYDPTFGGINWQMLDIPLADVDRIEVVRGPNATVLGIHAVNGAVNIITKHARLTQGGLVTLGGGTMDRANGSVRYGGRVGEEGYFRASLRGIMDGVMPGDGTPGADAQRQLASANVRLDLKPAPRDSLQVQAGVMNGVLRDRGELFVATPPYSVRFNGLEPAHDLSLSGRWVHESSPRASLSLQASGQQSGQVVAQVPLTSGMVALSARQRVMAGRHDIVADVDYRIPFDHIPPTAAVVHAPERYAGRQFSVAVQDEIAISPRTLRVTLGAKLQTSDRTDEIDVDPTIRIAWTPHQAHALWAAASQAERSASRSHLDVSAWLPPVTDGAGGTLLVKYVSNPALQPEHVVAFESGYRMRWHDRLTIDTSTFRNEYDNLIGTEALGLGFDGALPFISTRPVNGTTATTTGVETVLRVRARGRWTFDAAHAWLHARFRSLPGIVPQGIGSPVHQWNAGSHMYLPWGWKADARIYFVGRIADSGTAGEVDAYARVDARLSKAFTPRVTVSLIGQNLTTASHREALDMVSAAGTAIPRSAAVKLAWQF